MNPLVELPWVPEDFPKNCFMALSPESPGPPIGATGLHSLRATEPSTRGAAGDQRQWAYRPSWLPAWAGLAGLAGWLWFGLGLAGFS